jgi:broad specificity polyphosphatase/5'/3'-nucleotidase SurE
LKVLEEKEKTIREEEKELIKEKIKKSLKKKEKIEDDLKNLNFCKGNIEKYKINNISVVNSEEEEEEEEEEREEKRYWRNDKDMEKELFRINVLKKTGFIKNEPLFIPVYREMKIIIRKLVLDAMNQMIQNNI